jgi:hypothetical protein
MTNKDMVKAASTQSAPRPGKARKLPQPNPPPPIDDPNFQRDPRYPEIDPLDSTQLKPMLDEK